MERSKAAPSIVWFRQDLRLSDNPALTHAAARGHVIPIYVLDETVAPNGRPIGAASCWWLHHSLTALAQDLGGLVLLRGDPLQLVPEIAKKSGARGVYWNRCYEPTAIARDTKIKALLSQEGLDVASFNASLLFEPWQIATVDGQPFKVYSPFWRACLREEVSKPLPAAKLAYAPNKGVGDRLAAWQLLPSKPNWARGFEGKWRPVAEGQG